jgi:fatty acid desaturase
MPRSLAKEGIRRWKKQQAYVVNRVVTVMIVTVALGTYFWVPEGSVQWTADILFRTWVMFLGTVMAHEATHDLLGKTQRANYFWGRLSLLPVTVPFVNFRKTHRMHHAFTNDPERDPDYFVKFNSPWEMPFRALAVPHHWVMWLSARGRFNRKDKIEWVLNYVYVTLVHVWIASFVGVPRVALGLFVPLVLVSMLLWYPFAYKTHEGHSLGESEFRSHNYYGHVTYWFTLGLSMHRIHHEHPNLAWFEMHQFVEENPSGFWRLSLDRDIRDESRQTAAA